MRLAIIFSTMILIISCNKKEEPQDDVFMKISYNTLDIDNILNLEIINNSNKNYFICMDSLTIYENTEFGSKINRLLHPRIVFYSNSDSIPSGPTSSMPYYTSDVSNISHFKCVMQKAKERPFFIKQLKVLKKILILKSMDTINMKIPFKNRYEICYNTYTFLYGKGNYEMKLKYKMDSLFFNEIVDKTALENLKKQNIFPYHKEIKSNQIKFR